MSPSPIFPQVPMGPIITGMVTIVRITAKRAGMTQAVSMAATTVGSTEVAGIIDLAGR